MFSNRLGFAFLGIACVAAAASGGYFATRQNATEHQAVAAENAAPQATPAGAATATPAPGGSSLAQPVQETEQTPAPQPLPAKSSNVVERVAPPSKSGRISSTVTARNAPVPAPGRTASGFAAVAPQDAAPVVPAPSAAPSDPPAPVARQDEPIAPEPPKAEPEKPSEKSFEELVVSADSVIGLQLESTISSDRARVEDRVDARVIRDVRVGSQVAIPSGSHAIGSVMTVERGGKFKERARLGIRFHTLVLADGTQLPVTTETIYRYGDSPSNSSASKIGGGAVGGAILGAILGGAKGAALGAAAGAGGGAAVQAAGDRDAATFAAGTQMTARFLSPVTVTVEK